MEYLENIEQIFSGVHFFPKKIDDVFY